MNKSMEMKPKHTYAAIVALLLAATVSTTVVAMSAEVRPLTMAVIIDSAHGKKVTSGHYEQAIDRLTRQGAGRGSRFEAHVNLCVAYVKTSEIQKASNACDAAIAKVKEREHLAIRHRADRSEVAVAYKSDLALALSNRGVLKAATGDSDLARKDFLDAMQLETRLAPMIRNNLERLNQMDNTQATFIQAD